MKTNNSRENILSKIKQNQPEWVCLPTFDGLKTVFKDDIEKFKTTLAGIGGQVIEIAKLEEIAEYVQTHFSAPLRVVSTLPQLAAVAETNWLADDPHSLASVELAIIKAHFGVAENGALWTTEVLLGQRVTPFICQNLAVVLSKNDIVATMHHAYERIGTADYDFGTFIAGPSKTADIEQSLVLGAHGSRTMTVFLWGHK